jgi:hypothetical protein
VFLFVNLYSTHFGYMHGCPKLVLLLRALKANIIQQKTVESDYQPATKNPFLDAVT